MNLSNVPVDGSQYRNKIELKMFEKFLPNPSEIIQREREEDILQYGFRESFFIWETDIDPVHYHLLWGHLDFQFALENNLPFTITKVKFSSENDVKMFIIHTIGNMLHMSMFQKGILYLQNKSVFIQEGILRMRMGGQGIKVTDKWNTMKILSEMVGKGCSQGTLNKIDLIRQKLKDEEIYRQLENDEISIHKVFTELTEGTKGKNQFPLKTENPDGQISYDEKILENVKDLENKSPYFINEFDTYSVLFIKPSLDIKKSSRTEMVLENLKQMNISDISYNKYSTLFIQIPSLYLSEMIDIIRDWGFTCKDTLVVSYKKSRYQSDYSEHYNDLLLICHRNNVGVPILQLRNKLNKRTIPNERVFDTIDSMFVDNLSKVGIFTGHRKGWETFDFDGEDKQMVKFYKQMG